MREAQRLRLIALVHHPLALESGVEPRLRERLFASEREALRSARRIVVTSRATATALSDYDGDKFDSIYSSHNLEHFYPHDVPKVLSGFLEVLKSDGFVDIRVPDITSVLKTVVDNGMELDDVLYISPAGPISAHDVIYGWGAEIERSGVDEQLVTGLREEVRGGHAGDTGAEHAYFHSG